METAPAQFFLNYFSLGMFIPVMFHLFFTMFLLSVKKKSKATKHLTIAYALWVVFNFAYFIANSVYHPLTAYHRWFTVGSILFIVAHFNVFHFYFPDERNPRFARIYLITLYTFAAFVVIWFCATTFQGKIVYQPEAHYYDFDADHASKIFSLILLLYIGMQLPLAVWRCITVKSRERWVSLAIGIFAFIGGIVPGIANTLSRQGTITRETYQMTWVIFNVLCYCAVALLYLNNSRERTSFIGKLIMISGVTFIMLIQLISHITLADKDRSYDEARQNLISLILLNDHRPGDLEYIKSYSLRNNTFDDTYKRDGVTIDFERPRIEFMNTAFFESMRRLPAADFAVKADKLMNAMPPSFAGYRAFIRAELDRIPRDESNPGNWLAERLQKLNHAVVISANKIRQLPDTGQRQAVVKTLSSAPAEFAQFTAEVLSRVRNAAEFDARMKEEVLRMLMPMRAERTRLYRSDNGGFRHYMAYAHFNPRTDTIQEVGFSYTSYREYMHPFALKLFILLIVLLVAYRYGFSYFFQGALITPLKALSQGVRAVDEGNLEVSVPIRFEDEIGYITRSFNNMVASVKDSKQKLQDYTEHLEEKVRERTLDLQIARDALMGEMRLAKKIQTALLPESPAMKGFEIAAAMEPTAEVGGDYYDVINVQGLDWLVIGDVSGHGIPAGLIMMMVQTSIHTALGGHPNLKPEYLLSRINKVITENVRKLNENKYMTLTVIACIKEERFFYSGLHQDIMLYRQATKSIELIETDGMWIGMMDDISKMVEGHQFTLHQGDVMLLYTDGIVEANLKETKPGTETTFEMYGQERLAATFLRFAEASPETIKKGILEDLTDYSLTDDITLLIVKKV